MPAPPADDAPPIQPPLGVLLVGEQLLVREGLKLLLESDPTFAVVGETTDAASATAMVPALRPDVVVMDLAMTALNCLAAVRAVRASDVAVPLVALTWHKESYYVEEMLRAGTSGFVLHQSPPAVLTAAIRSCFSGRCFVDPAVAHHVTSCNAVRESKRRTHSRDHALSARETEILKLIAVGHRQIEVARELKVSVKTVEAHKSNSMMKLGLEGRTDLTRYALLKGWLGD